jgi:uroporphyrin-3 C-methyltransferase/uroporphyrinogen III methyltransferase/synthase
LATQQDKSKKPTQTNNKNRAAEPQKKEAKPIVKNSSAKKEKSGGGIGWLALILTLALAGAGYYFYMQFQASFKSLNSSIEKLDNSAANQQAAASKSAGLLKSEIRTTLDQAQQEISSAAAEQAESLAQAMQQLTETAARLNRFETETSDSLRILERQIGKNRPDWLIAEAEYLLSIANQRLHLAGDIKTALIALKEADKRLKENGDAALFPVRAVIAKDISQLKSTPQPDLVGLASRLFALEGGVHKMAVLLPHAGKITTTPVAAEERPKFGDWEKLAATAWENLKTVAVVRRSDKPIQIMLTPQQVEVIRQSLTLKLEMARLALVQENEQLYKANLDAAKAWLTRHFDMKAIENRHAESEINDLSAALIKTPTVDISKSLRALRAVPILKLNEEERTTAGSAS